MKIKEHIPHFFKEHKTPVSFDTEPAYYTPVALYSKGLVVQILVLKICHYFNELSLRLQSNFLD